MPTYPSLLFSLALSALAGCAAGSDAPHNKAIALPSAASEVTDITPTSELAIAPVSSSQPTSTVASVGDGDTIRVLKDGDKTTVRLVCIDAEETA